MRTSSCVVVVHRVLRVLCVAGGAFRDWPVDKLKNVTVADALKHPNWR